MRREQVIAELERLAQRLGVEVRYEKMGALAGGLCRLREKLLLFVNRALSPQSKIELISSELRRLPWEEHFVRPEVRALLEGEALLRGGRRRRA